MIEIINTVFCALLSDIIINYFKNLQTKKAMLKAKLSLEIKLSLSLSRIALEVSLG
ncbi:MAG: hypothetical protein ACOYOT_11985 [Bacteroidales bacterium]